MKQEMLVKDCTVQQAVYKDKTSRESFYRQMRKERVVRVFKQDLEIYRNVQKNAEQALQAISIIADKVNDEQMERQLMKQGVKYSEFRNRALHRLLEEKENPYRGTYIQNMLLAAEIHTNTLFNTSTSHIAQMAILGSSRGLTDLWKALNHNRQAEKQTVEFAKELVDFEEQNIEKMKSYL